MQPEQTRLVLIRHGQSQAQLDGVAPGHEDCTGLSQHGREQAVALRDRLLASRELQDAAAVYTSVARRAIETAEVIDPALNGTRPQSTCELCEMHTPVGGMKWEDIRRRYTPRSSSHDPFERRIPGEETWAEMYARVGGGLQRLRHEHPGQLVVAVCHGGVIGASFVALGHAPLRAGRAYIDEVTNTSMTEWRWTGADWRLVRFNDSAHLRSTL